jgi:HTH-like domain
MVCLRRGGHADVLPIAQRLLSLLEEFIKASRTHLVFPAANGLMRTDETDLQQVLRRAMGAPDLGAATCTSACGRAAATKNRLANQADHYASRQCRVLGIHESGFYAWRKRPPSRRATDDAVLIARIKAIHEMSDGTNGARRLQAELADVDGRRVNIKRVARLMRRINGGHAVLGERARAAGLPGAP